jgi:hypothetical protein
MNESNEKWFVLAIIAVAIWFFWKKAKTSFAAAPNIPQEAGVFPAIGSTFGSVVNPTLEMGSAQPAQATRPVLYSPAQPSSTPTSTRVGYATPTNLTASRLPLRTYSGYTYYGSTSVYRSPIVYNRLA